MRVLRASRCSVRSNQLGQRGVALVVTLILLLIATLIGLAGARSTSLQERMSGNMYDRSLAFQRAEAALRAAERAITTNAEIASLGGEDCSPQSGATCATQPSTAFTGSSAGWTAVADRYNVNSALAPGRPEYFVQFMGAGNAEENLGLEANADYTNYGSAYPPDKVAYYRVTARSSSPAQAGDRSIVVLQITVKRPI
jgi:type IV pilus assembly protein PilX